LFEPTGSRRDAASVIFNLPEYRVVEAVDLRLGGRRVKVEPVEVEDGCPACGVVSSRVHAWVEQRVRDIPHAGQVVVVVRKPRLVCAEPACGRRTFTTATEQLPVRARCTTRLKTALLEAVIGSGPGGLGGRQRLTGGVVDGAGDGQRRGGAAAGGRQPARPPARHR
jgi:transposase